MIDHVINKENEFIIGDIMNKINSDEIKYFLVVAECLNFTEASKRLFVSQPAITKWIKHLEKEIGIELFKRNSKSVSLTPAGEYLYKEWLNISNNFQNTLVHAHKICNPENDSIHIGVIYGLDYDNYLSKKINQFRSLYPNISIHIHIYNFYEMKANAAEMDFILSSSLEVAYLPDCEHIIIDEMKVNIAMSRDNSLADKENLSMLDLKDEVFFCVSEQTKSKCIQNLIEQFTAINVHPIIQSVDNIQSCLMAVQLNQGVSIIDEKFFIPNEDVILRKCADFSPELYRIFIFNHKFKRDSVMALLELFP